MTQTRTMTDLWTYRDIESLGTIDVTGFKVEAIDGEIGSVDEATWETGRSHLVVDTGPWIFGKKVLLPAGLIDRIDVDNQRCFVQRTKNEINNAPEFDEGRYLDETYRTELGTYYAERSGVDRPF
jgi:hypothetical protein